MSDERDPSGRFVRGLTLGAILGAIIAGSSLWTRARARRRMDPIAATARSKDQARPRP